MLIDPFELLDVSNREAVEARFNRHFEAIGVEIDAEFARIGPTEPPQLLYHYTNAGGLKGIIDSGSIFLTDAFFLNDQSELHYGRELALEVLSSRAQKASSPLRTFFTTAVASFDPFAERPHGFAYYVSSFCENGNLLSQWRAYGGQGAGFALGFLAESLSGEARVQREHTLTPVLHRVEYNRDNQRRLVDFVVDRCASLLEAELELLNVEMDANVLMSGWFTLLAVHLTSLFPQFKHPMFFEEREWRLTLARLSHEEDGLLSFREAGDELVPYIAFPLAPTESGLVPLDEIVLAPGGEPELRRRAVKKFLRAKQYPEDSVRLIGSDIPLRLHR